MTELTKRKAKKMSNPIDETLAEVRRRISDLNELESALSRFAAMSLPTSEEIRESIQPKDGKPCHLKETSAPSPVVQRRMVKSLKTLTAPKTTKLSQRFQVADGEQSAVARTRACLATIREPFTVVDLATAAGVKTKAAQNLLYHLSHRGDVVSQGKAGTKKLYVRKGSKVVARPHPGPLPRGEGGNGALPKSVAGASSDYERTKRELGLDRKIQVPRDL